MYSIKQTALALLLCLFTCSALLAQPGNPHYNKALADSLGADDYGMKRYVFVILKTGPSTLTDKEQVNKLFEGHMSNINRLVKENKLVVAGPFMKNDKAYRGLFILNVATLEEARALVNTDPAVREQLLEAELLEWYGSAALPLYLKASEKVAKKKF